MIKKLVKRIPVFGKLLQQIYRRRIKPSRNFKGSTRYWIERYHSGGNSGDGSYNILAEFKARILNDFVRDHGIQTVIEYGCGDGNQLRYADYPEYTGFDISPDALVLCRKTFANDSAKTFRLVGEYSGETAELTLSLDVLFHLVEDDLFDEYMERLFNSSEHYVIVYSSNIDDLREGKSPHVRHRMFTKWVEEKRPEWKLLQHIPNEHEFQGDTRTGSFSDFYIYAKVAK